MSFGKITLRALEPNLLQQKLPAGGLLKRRNNANA
jgi:hypothetical protein